MYSRLSLKSVCLISRVKTPGFQRQLKWCLYLFWCCWYMWLRNKLGLQLIDRYISMVGKLSTVSIFVSDIFVCCNPSLFLVTYLSFGAISYWLNFKKGFNQIGIMLGVYSIFKFRIIQKLMALNYLFACKIAKITNTNSRQNSGAYIFFSRYRTYVIKEMLCLCIYLR